MNMITVLLRRGEGAAREGGDERGGALALLMPAVNLIFFGLVGAGIQLVRFRSHA